MVWAPAAFLRMNSRDVSGNGDVDDAFRSLLEGLRTTLPGVQVLFAFLLILPLQGSFSALGPSERIAFYVSFFTSAIASILFFAPGAHQRLRAPITGVRRRSERDLRTTVHLTIAGTFFFAISLVSAVALVSLVVLRANLAVAVTLGLATLIAWAWFYLPWVAFQRDHHVDN